MSILTQLLHGKITFGQAVTEVEGWFSTLLSKAPANVQTDIASGLSGLKQAASNAVMLADTAAGAIIAAGAVSVEAAANTALTALVGPANATALTPGVDSMITQGAEALKAEIDAVAAQLRASIVGTPVGVASTSLPSPAQTASTSSTPITSSLSQ